MSRIRRRPEEELEDIEDVGTLEGCGLGKGGEEGNVVGAGGAAGAETDFAEDDEGAQGAFGVVVGGRPVVCDEGKELFVLRGVGQEAFAKSFGFGKGERVFAMGAEFGAQACDEGFLFLPGCGDRHLAGFLKEGLDVFAKAHGGGIGLRDEGEFLADFASLAQKVGEAALAVAGNGVVGRISIGDQKAVELFAKQ